MYIDYHHLHFADHQYPILVRLTDIYVSVSDVYSTPPRARDIFRTADILLKMQNNVITREHLRNRQAQRRNVWICTWVPGMMSVAWISCNA